MIKYTTGDPPPLLSLPLQPYGHVLQHVSVQPTPPAGLQASPPPPVVTVLQPPPEPPLAPDPAVEIPKLLMPSADMSQVVEEVAHSMSQNPSFIQHLQQVRCFRIIIIIIIIRICD